MFIWGVSYCHIHVHHLTTLYLGLQGALSESHVTNPLSSAYQRALFLIHSDVFKEIISFGLESTNKRVSTYIDNAYFNYEKHNRLVQVGLCGVDLKV